MASCTLTSFLRTTAAANSKDLGHLQISFSCLCFSHTTSLERVECSADLRTIDRLACTTTKQNLHVEYAITPVPNLWHYQAPKLRPRGLPSKQECLDPRHQPWSASACSNIEPYIYPCFEWPGTGMHMLSMRALVAIRDMHQSPVKIWGQP